jgi:imidazolonepropionase
MPDKENVDLIVGNTSEIVTCASGGMPKKGLSMVDAGRIDKGWAAVKNGQFVAVGTSEEIESDFRAPDFLDAEGKAVVPGFVESHTHIVYGGNRVAEFELRIKGADYLEIFEAGGGIHSSVRATRSATRAELLESARRRLDKLAAGGVTTCEIKTGYGLDTESELKMLDVIISLNREHSIDAVPTFLPAHAVPQDWKGREDEFTDLICDEMIPKASQRLQDAGFGGKALYFIDVFCEKGAFNLEQSKKVILAAQAHGFSVKAHVDEFTNLGCARFAIEQGAVSIDHLDATSDEEISLLAASNTVGIVTPTVNFNFGSTEFADARKMIDAGCAIAVSTDYNPGSAPCPSLQTAMAIACRYQKLLPSEAINAVTINGAAAVGRSKTHGSIEGGKVADFLLLDTDDYREICYEFGWNFVSAVYKNGRLI